MSEPCPQGQSLSARIAEAKARAEAALNAARALPPFGLTKMYIGQGAADVLFLADQLARAHAVIEAARAYSVFSKAYDEAVYARDWQTCEILLSESDPYDLAEAVDDALSDFDRGEQG